MKTAKEEWKGFGRVILSPWVVVFLVVTVVLNVVLVVFSASVGVVNTVVITVLSVFASAAAGVLGGFVAKKWDEFTGKAVLVTRGKSAVRSLKLLMRNVTSLEGRVSVYLDRYRGEDRDEHCPPSVVVTYLEEVIGRCQVLQEETVSSIENWTDIVPEADIMTQIGVLSERAAEIEQLRFQRQDLTIELEETKDKSAGEAKKLRTRIREKEKELSEARKELSEARYGLTGSPLGRSRVQLSSFQPIQITSESMFHFSPTETVQCSQCGKTFERSLSVGTFYTPSRCPDCGPAGLAIDSHGSAKV